MSKLKVGFARIDITPPLGVRMSGYSHERLADGILDPLLATAIAANDGENTAVIMSLDLVGIRQERMDEIRHNIAERIGTSPEAVFVACTHIHTGPYAGHQGLPHLEDAEYISYLMRKLSDVAVIAVDDMAPAEMYTAKNTVKNVSFIRRYRMKDGTVRTNPAWLDPNIVGPLREPDENVSLVLFKREGKKEIAVINFQVHPDTIGGTKYSADYPKFVRDTYEKMMDNSLCMYINGTQGDSNHFDLMHMEHNEKSDGYGRTEYMGRAIASAAASVYTLAERVEGERIRFGQKNVEVLYKKGTEEQMRAAAEGLKKYEENGKVGHPPMYIYTLMLNEPDTKILYVTAVSIGDVAFAGFPGEPFTEMGVQTKARSKFMTTITACCANGYEGYLPVKEEYDLGGYEADTARYVKGSAEKLVDNSVALLDEMHGE